MSTKRVQYKSPPGKLKKRPIYTPSMFDAGDRTIAFVFEKFDGGMSWLKRGERKKHDFFKLAGRLKHYEHLTFEKLAQESNCHKNNLDEIDSRAKKRALDLQFDDEEELWSIKIFDVERIWGYEYGDKAFVVIWWDPNHLIRKSVLRSS